MSMMKQVVYDEIRYLTYLFYANRTKEEAAYLDVLKDLAAKNTHSTFIPVMTRQDKDSWDGETGHITSEMIRKYNSDINSSLYYLAGPAGMVNAMMQMLTTAGVDPIFIKSEDFGEYK